MAEASIKWKVDTLREIMAAPLHAQWMPDPEGQDMDWFIDMKKDGYVEGTWGTLVDMEEAESKMRKGDHSGLYSGKQVFSELHVTEKGKKLVRDYEAKLQATDALKKLNPKELLNWDDKKLAEWQSHFKSDQPQWILADQEWKRRAGISTRKIALAAFAVSVLSFLVAALGYFHSINVASTPAPQKPPAQSVKLPPPLKPIQK